MSLSKELTYARTCYKHLAGELGVAITRSFLSTGLVNNAIVQDKHCFSITTKGYRWCMVHAIAVHNDSKLDGIRQVITKSCLDHSHQEPHIAGELGHAILNFMLLNDYCECVPGRRVRVTAKGIQFLHCSLGIGWRNHFGGAEK
ncbi:hypothetical protein [Candidatus Spongiihabitans sp.]|uniref:hypothetical protein n=1 Tax=Candidatus Spongiihabitans sp. TaxID=3101308 RepID=UPI003C6FD861